MLRNVKESEWHGQRQDFLALVVSQLISSLNSGIILALTLSTFLKHRIWIVFFPSFPCKESDRLDSRNWRPITLQNVDFKLSARTLAACLLQFIPFVVHSDQTCSIPGRYMVKMSLLRSAAIFSLDQ